MSDDTTRENKGISRRAAMAAGFVAAAGLSTSRVSAQVNRRTYVLVHGAWFGGWVWKPVAEELRSKGHIVYTPSLTGLGDRKHLLRAGINLDTHTTDVVNLIEMEDLSQVVLVGWSYGGMVISDVLGRIPERIGSVVYLDAFLPERGRSASSYTARTALEGTIRLAAEGRDIPPLPVDSFAVTDQQVIDFTTARISPHPVLTFLQESKAPESRPDIPHTYVLAGLYAERSQTFSTFYKQFQDKQLGDAHILEAGHVMMLTNIAETVNLLASVK